jgi:hypothetical protein
MRGAAWGSRAPVGSADVHARASRDTGFGDCAEWSESGAVAGGFDDDIRGAVRVGLMLLGAAVVLAIGADAV